MFGIDSSELLLVAFVALIVIGPKDLPKAMRVVGLWVGRARGIARQFRSGFDNMVREAELEEMEKKWASENERIMREHPQNDAVSSAQEPVDMEPVTQPTILPEAATPVSIEKPHVEAGSDAPAADAKAPS